MNQHTKQFAMAWFVAGRTADFKCPRCNTDMISMDEQCSAILTDRCPGFEAMEKARADFPAHWEGRLKA
jgi:predicted RNA-binding Zn-ribbon protein involved in translation (DUF1610 family)